MHASMGMKHADVYPSQLDVEVIYLIIVFQDRSKGEGTLKG